MSAENQETPDSKISVSKTLDPLAREKWGPDGQELHPNATVASGFPSEEDVAKALALANSRRPVGPPKHKGA